MPEPRPLLLVQQNQIYAAIKEIGLDPADFQWTEKQKDTYVCPLLTYRPGGHSFYFGFYGEKRCPHWSPVLYGNDSFAFADGWSETLKYFLRWLSAVKSDADAPDMWGALRGERAITNAAEPAGDNRPFVGPEIAELEQKLGELKSYLEARHVHGAPERTQLEGRFRYLIEAARRGVGRIDWLNIFIAQMFAMVMAGLIPSTAWGDAMRMAATLFHGVIAALKTLGS